MDLSLKTLIILYGLFIIITHFIKCYNKIQICVFILWVYITERKLLFHVFNSIQLPSCIINYTHKFFNKLDFSYFSIDYLVSKVPISLVIIVHLLIDEVLADFYNQFVRYSNLVSAIKLCNKLRHKRRLLRDFNCLINTRPWLEYSLQLFRW